MGGSSKSSAVRNGRTGRFEKALKVDKGPDRGEEVAGACAKSTNMDISHKPSGGSDQQARGAHSDARSDADSGYAGEEALQATEPPSISTALQPQDLNPEMGQNGLVVGSSIAPSPRGTETQEILNTMPSLDAPDEGDWRMQLSLLPTLDMKSLIPSPYQVGLKRRLSIISLPGFSHYSTGLPRRRMSLEEVRADAQNKRRKIQKFEHSQVAGDLLRKQVEASAATQPPFFPHRRGIENGRDGHMLSSGPLSDSGRQAAMRPSTHSANGLANGTANKTARATVPNGSTHERFTDYDEEDSLAWIDAHHNNITKVLQSGDPDPLKSFPMVSRHALALWSMNLSLTHKPNCRFGRVLLPAPPEAQSDYSMRHAPRDPGPKQKELDDAVQTYFDAMTRDNKLAMHEEIDFLLTTLRWSMSLTSLRQTIARRFTVFVQDRRPEFVDEARWGLLHAWLNRQHGTTAQQIWEKPGVEEGWDVTVPAGMPYWSGVDAPSTEHKVRAWSPHPNDGLPDEPWGRENGFKSELKRDKT